MGTTRRQEKAAADLGDLDEILKEVTLPPDDPQADKQGDVFADDLGNYWMCDDTDECKFFKERTGDWMFAPGEHAD